MFHGDFYIAQWVHEGWCPHGRGLKVTIYQVTQTWVILVISNTNASTRLYSKYMCSLIQELCSFPGDCAEACRLCKWHQAVYAAGAASVCCAQCLSLLSKVGWKEYLKNSFWGESWWPPNSWWNNYEFGDFLFVIKQTVHSPRWSTSSEDKLKQNMKTMPEEKTGTRTMSGLSCVSIAFERIILSVVNSRH